MKWSPVGDTCLIEKLSRARAGPRVCVSRAGTGAADGCNPLRYGHVLIREKINIGRLDCHLISVTVNGCETEGHAARGGARSRGGLLYF